MMNCRVQTSNRQDPKTFRQEYKHTPTTQYAGHQYAGHQYAAPKLQVKATAGVNQTRIQKLWDMAPTPINTSVLETMLQYYPDKQIAQELILGFKNGFSIHYTGIRSPIIAKNMKSATAHAEQLAVKIYQEVELGRISGPFLEKPISNLRCSPIGLIPKKQGGWRMICNLSAPFGKSVNDDIDPKLCSVQYSSFDSAIEMIQKLGTSALLGKKDIASAFRLLPIRPEDFCLLGFQFQGIFFIDKCLPFGCSIACATFEKFSTALHWLIEQHSSLDSIVHYIDDFLFAGPAKSENCKELMATFDIICDRLGVPISQDKTKGPSTKLTFPGLGIDTDTQTIYVPPDKVQNLQTLLLATLQSKKLTLKEMQALIGSLAFICKALPAGRAFCRRFYDSLSSASKPFHRIRITRELKEDIEIWLTFLENYNGSTPFPDPLWVPNNALCLASDSAGSFGRGVIFKNLWAYMSWPEEWSSDIRRDLTYLELVPVALAIHIWGESLQSSKIVMQVDNLAVVHILNNKTSKSPRVMSLLRPLLQKLLQFNIQLHCMHVPGYTNVIADAISRFQWDTFRQVAPHADFYPCQIPSQFWPSLSLL
ncbi:hypothetical protein FSP39_016826 [Pinctada imbricata]|uniref:Reverse transcriptase domain-containing protein n=1 Tax=Pinctada imbricata TaxID=66713 RepID=A0AA88YE30_PINIB|nr:hypothetical protein FSP39_016826 [Pinctada imbricata]